MKKTIVCAFLFLGLCGNKLFAQSPFSLFIDTAGILEYNGKVENVGFLNENGLNTTDSAIRIDTIAATAFQKFKKKYHFQIDTDTTRVGWTDTSFTLTFRNTSTTFPANRICECTVSSYAGFLMPLNLYIINTTDMKNELEYVLMIDSRTGKPYECFSPYDEGTQAVCISPGNHYLLTYANTTYEHNMCVLDFLKVNMKNNRYTLQDVMQVNINNLNIKDLVWITERSLALSVTEQLLADDGSEIKMREYCLKITIPAM